MTISRWPISNTKRPSRSIHPLPHKPVGHLHTRKRMQRASTKRPVSASVVGEKLLPRDFRDTLLAAPGVLEVNSCEHGHHECSRCGLRVPIAAAPDPKPSRPKLKARKAAPVAGRCAVCGAKPGTKCAPGCDDDPEHFAGPCAQKAAAAPAPAAPAPRFKVGDGVRVRESTVSKYRRRSGAVEKYTGSLGEHMYSVRLSAVELLTFGESEIEPVAEDPAPAKPEAGAVLRYACGSEVMLGDEIRHDGREDTTYRVLALNESYDGSRAPGELRIEDRAVNGVTGSMWCLPGDCKLLSRAPAGAEVPR